MLKLRYWFPPVDIDQHVGSSLEGVDPISAGVDSDVVAVVCGGEVAAAADVLLSLLAAARAGVVAVVTAGVVAVVAAGVGRGCCGCAHQLVTVLQQQQQQLHSSSFQFRFYNNYENVE